MIDAVATRSGITSLINQEEAMIIATSDHSKRDDIVQALVVLAVTNC